MQQIEIHVIERADGLTHVVLSGRLDAGAVDKIGKRFQAETVARGRPAIVDMSGVDFIASVGLGMLLTAARALHLRGSRTVIVDPKPLVRRVMEAAQMPSVIPLVATIADAESFLSD